MCQDYLFAQNEDGSVKVTWWVSGALDFLIRPIGQNMMNDAFIGPDFENGLKNLKAHVEEHAAMEPEAPALSVEELEVESFNYLSMTDSVTVENIGSSLGNMYGKIGGHMAANQIEPAGPPFTIYHTWDGKSTKMEAGMPTGEETKGSEEIASGMSYAGPALKVTYMGPYEGTGAAHEAIDVYATANGKEIVGPPWEIYITDPGTEPDTSKWITEVYYPIK